MAEIQPRGVVSKLDSATRIVRAINRFLLQVAGCMRLLVTVAGWLVLLWSTVTLLVHPHVPPAHLVVPGAGALAVIQGMVKTRSKPRNKP